MRILFVSPLPLDPADEGVKTHLAGILENLLAAGHAVRVIGFAQTEAGAASWPRYAGRLKFDLAGVVRLRQGAALRWAQVRAVLSGEPPAPAYYQSAMYRELLETELKKEPDWVIFGQYGVAAGERVRGRARSLLLPVDSYRLYYERLARRTRSWRTKASAKYLAWSFARSEVRWREVFDWIAPVAEPDAASLAQGKRGKARIAVLPVAEEGGRFRWRTGRRVAVLGAFQLKTAEEGALELMEFWSQAGIEAELVVWGRRASRRLQEAVAKAGGRYVNWVPDYRAFLDSMDLVIYPQRSAAGIQTKVQQSMAQGIPVVAHPEVLEGLGARHGEDAFAAVTAPGFLETARRLLADPERRNAIGQAASAGIAERYGKERIAHAIEAVLATGVNR